MSTLRDFCTRYDRVEVNVRINPDEKNINNIEYVFNGKEYNILLKWKDIDNLLINPKGDIFSTIQYHISNIPDEDYQILSSTSLTSASVSDSKNPDSDEYLTKVFIRGLVSVIVLTQLIYKHGYIRLKLLPHDHEIFTRNNLKILRMGIIIHLKCLNTQDKFLKHALDFINRWESLFIKGPSIDKSEALLELITNYLCTNKKIDKPILHNIDNSDLSKRISRIESILGITNNE
tara:strand:- start:598 stop:1296 length:699 start_codon:yes stop_codon:yes gene_type:complete